MDKSPEDAEGAHLKGEDKVGPTTGRSSIALDPPPPGMTSYRSAGDMMKSLADDTEDEVGAIVAYNDGRTPEQILEGYTTAEAQKMLDKVSPPKKRRPAVLASCADSTYFFRFFSTGTTRFSQRRSPSGRRSCRGSWASFPFA